MRSVSGYRPLIGALCLLIVIGTGAAKAEEVILENAFASMKLDGKKIGQIHFTMKKGADGQIDELQTNVSVSVLGFNVYRYAQHLHETWRDGIIQVMRSDTDENGTKEVARVDRKDESYKATHNGKPVDLPGNVFPDSIWHYEITKQTELFNTTDLRLMKVSVARSEEKIEHNGKTVAAERFDFTGDWLATLWFSDNQRLLQAHREIDGHKVIIHVDSDT